MGITLNALLCICVGMFACAPVCELTSLRAVNRGMWEVISGRKIEVSRKWLTLITADICQVLFECKVPHLKLHVCVEWSSSMLPFDYGNAPCIWGARQCIARKSVCVCLCVIFFWVSLWIGKTCLTSCFHGCLFCVFIWRVISHTADVGDRDRTSLLKRAVG